MDNEQVAESFRRIASVLAKHFNSGNHDLLALIISSELHREADRLCPRKNPREFWVNPITRLAYPYPRSGEGWVKVREVIE